MAATPDGAASPGAAPAPPPSPLNGAEKVYTVTDTRSAGEAIAGLLFGDDTGPIHTEEPAAAAPAERSRGDEPPDTGADESQPTGQPEKTESQGEQPPPGAAIEPPRSWNADEQAEFAKLPPALRQAVARRESQREAVLTQRSQEAAEYRRAVDAERQAAMAQRAEYLAGLQKMLVLAAPEMAALQNIDWVAVQAQSPAEYTRLQALRDAMRARLGAIEGEFQQQQAWLAAQQHHQLAELVANEHRLLNQRMPEFADQVRGDALRRDLGTYLREMGGFSPQEINQAYDHRMVLVAYKAMLWERQQAAARAADAKRNNPAPAVQRPGVSQDAADRGPTSRLDRAVQRLGRTNSVRDAGSLIAELL